MCVLLLLLNVRPGLVSADVLNATDSETGLASWTWRDRGVSLQLRQLLPDQTRAFFLGRGFQAGEADRVGRACVFQTIFRNDGGKPVAFPLPMDRDSAVIDSWPIMGLPTTFVIDPRGRLFYRAIGGRAWDAPELLAPVRALKQ